MPHPSSPWVRRALDALLPFLLLLLVLAAAPHPAFARARGHAARACANAGARVSTASRNELERAVVCLVNERRAAHGLPALRDNARLDRAAQGWTDRMVRDRTFSHGSDFAGRITAAGFHWSAAGENIATGYSTPSAVVSAWMASPEHCRNILAPNFSAIGVGVVGHAVTRSGRDAATWTQDFALPIGSSAPSGRWGPARGCPYAS